MMDLDSDILLDLRRGDRQGFGRYFELYRAPVYGLVRLLLRDGQDAISATQDAFTSAYRRILLADGRIDLRAWTFKAAVDVCRERLDEREGRRAPAGGMELGGPDTEESLRRATPGAVSGTALREPDELSRRIVQALGMVEFDHRAVLLLHDVGELQPAELATVFGVTEDAAGVLLFRAREAFRRAFEDVSSDQRRAACRLAEQMFAGAVGGSLSTAELDRLREHAAYCRDCRRTMKGWETGALGLAWLAKSAPLPKALEAAPVFGTVVPMTGAANSAAGAGALTGALAWIGRAAAGRAAAYAFAAVCLTVALGLAVVHPWSDRSVIVLSTARLEVPSSARPTWDVALPPISRTTATGPSAKASAVTFLSSASASQEVIGLLAQFAAPAGVSGPVATAAANIGRLAGGRVAGGGSTSSGDALTAGTRPSARGDRERAQPEAKQKAAKVGSRHGQEQPDKQNNAKARNEAKDNNKPKDKNKADDKNKSKDKNKAKNT